MSRAGGVPGASGTRGRGRQRREDVPGRVRLGRVHALRPGGPLGGHGATALQLVQQGAFTASAHQQQDEGVLVQQPRHLVAERGRVTAVVPGVAVALRLQIAHAGQQFDSGGGRVLHQVRRHVPVQQRRDVTGPLDRHVQKAVPLSVGQLLQQDVGAVRGAVAVLDDGGDAPRAHRHGAHGSRAREPAARLQLLGVQRRVLQRLQPGPPPPGLARNRAPARTAARRRCAPGRRRTRPPYASTS